MNSFNLDVSQANNHEDANSSVVEVADATLQFSLVKIADPTPTGRQLALAAGVRKVEDMVILQLLPDGQLEDIL